MRRAYVAADIHMDYGHYRRDMYVLIVPFKQAY